MSSKHLRNAALALCVIVSLLCASSALARSSDDFATQGTVELSGTFGFNLDSTEELAFTLTASPNIGFFVADGLELSLSPGFIFTAAEGGSEAAALLLAGPSYNLYTGSAVYPFFGLVGGITEGASFKVGPAEVATSGLLTGPDITAVVGGELGIKIQIGNAGVLRPQVQVLVVPFENQTLVHVAAQFGAGMYF